MYTQKQLQDMLQFPSTTFRRYVQNFADYLSEGAKRKENRTFDDADYEKLEFIRSRYNENWTKKQICQALSVNGQHIDVYENGSNEQEAQDLPETIRASQDEVHERRELPKKSMDALMLDIEEQLYKLVDEISEDYRRSRERINQLVLLSRFSFILSLIALGAAIYIIAAI